jgi:serine/threonine-protein kinase
MTDRASRGGDGSGTICPRCSRSVSADNDFCGGCGAPLSPDSHPTQTSVRTGDLGAVSPLAASGEGDRAPRFLPGAVLAGRYRIFGLVGSGGMGEVYRADDLKLAQPVALKFLPQRLERDPQRLARFLGEVKTARRVAHPNVCRVYDVTEIDGQHCLSMEYVDGEDLASLLRRIGRLPEDKALQIARQICAGLAAAHELGIVHRDLKPANVMIDSRGTARITDFGLAGLVEEIRGAEVRAGTPAYMSPEQLAGREVSFKSDIYALGLVLYELFTGKPAFERAESVAELARARQESLPTRPSRVLDSLDPAVERVILRCLEPDPARRPSGALAVAVALPGGDPLAAALAAGETPSPELVAAVGSAEAMRPALAAGLALVAAAAFFVGAWLNGRSCLRGRVPLDKPPAALADRAQEMIAELGYTEPVYSRPTDSAFGFDVWVTALNRIQRADDSDRRWDALRDPRAGVVSFWYRQSPLVMQPRTTHWRTLAGRWVERWNPFPRTTGQVMVTVGPAGRLQFFVHTPRRFTEEGEPPPEPDWSVPFRLAGLEIDSFRRVEPRYQRFMQLDHRAAWVGRIPGRTGEDVRIEAGAHDGRVSLWGILEPDELEGLILEPKNLRGPTIEDTLFFLVITGGLIAGAFFARRNLRVGRADRSGTVRLAVFIFGLVICGELLRAHRLLTSAGWTEIYPITATALFYAVAAAVLYLAIEPHARRIWPSMLVSWSRLLGRSASWRDPRIGTSVLWGCLAAAGLTAVLPLRVVLISAAQGAPAMPTASNWNMLLGARYALSNILMELNDSLTATFFLVLLLVLGRVTLRRAWLAIAAATVVWLILGGPMQNTVPETLVALAFSLISTAVFFTVLLRQGVVALLACAYSSELAFMAQATDFRVWHGRPALLALAVFGAIVAYGYWASTAQLAKRHPTE